MIATPTPALDKMLAVINDLRAILEFLAWLDEQRITLAMRYEAMPDDVRLYPIQRGTEQLLADYFGVDLGATERERRALLNELRNRQP